MASACVAFAGLPGSFWTSVLVFPSLTFLSRAFYFPALLPPCSAIPTFPLFLPPLLRRTLSLGKGEAQRRRVSFCMERNDGCRVPAGTQFQLEKPCPGLCSEKTGQVLGAAKEKVQVESAPRALHP